MVKFIQDWDREGHIVMLDPPTIQIYEEYQKILVCCLNYEKNDLTIEDSRELYREALDRVLNECDPQEVYFWEWNNYECMFSGDDAAMARIYRLWYDPKDPDKAVEILQKIHRVNKGRSIPDIISRVERDLL